MAGKSWKSPGTNPCMLDELTVLVVLKLLLIALVGIVSNGCELKSNWLCGWLWLWLSLRLLLTLTLLVLQNELT